MDEHASTAGQRTVRWHDPLGVAAAARGRTGLAFMQALLAGEIPPPPIAELMNFAITAVRQGEVEFTCHPDASMYNPIGAVHGGVVCTLLDSVLGCAVQTTLPAETTYTSIDLQVSYLRGVTPSSAPLVAVGRVTKPGRRVAFASGEVRDAAGRPVASGTGSCLVFPLPPAG